MDQTTDKLISKLSQLGAPSVVDSRIEATFDSRRAREKVAKWLSDWHLLAYWNQVGFLGQDDIKELARIATSPDLEDPTLLDGLLEKDGWQTLMAVVGDSARKYLRVHKNVANILPASKPSGSSRQMDNDGFEEIPPELLDEMMDVDSIEGGASRPRSRLGGDAPAGGGKKVCPHCTYENESGATDCDVCGLPL